MPDPILSVKGLSTGYGDFQALFDVSLSLREKSILGLVGANGAGKSTLFKAILGQLPRKRDMVIFKASRLAMCPPRACHGWASRWCPRGGGCSGRCRLRKT